MLLAMTKRILIQTVGTGGPSNPVWEALAFAVSSRRPHLLVQWCSQLTAEQTIPAFDQALHAAHRPPDIRRVTCDDPDDVSRLALDYLNQIDELRSEFREAQIELDFTSGTKPMSVAAVAAAVARRLPLLHYAVGPRDESGRAIRTDRLISLSTAPLVAERQLLELGVLFDAAQFTAVRRQAEALAADLLDQRLLARARSLAMLADAYEAWDRFDWDDAFAKLREYKNIERRDACFSTAGWDLTAIARQVVHLKHCAKDPAGPQRLADILANSDRCIAAGRHDDAVARLYRLTEYIAQVRFVKAAGLKWSNNPTGNVPMKQIEERAPALAGELMRQRNGSERISLGLRHVISFLAEAGDSVGRTMHDRYHGGGEHRQRGPLHQQLEIRNGSLLAHGSRPVEAKAAEDLRNTVAAILEEHLQTLNLSLEAVLAPARFVTCPWRA